MGLRKTDEELMALFEVGDWVICSHPYMHGLSPVPVQVTRKTAKRWFHQGKAMFKDTVEEKRREPNAVVAVFKDESKARDAAVKLKALREDKTAEKDEFMSKWSEDFAKKRRAILGDAEIDKKGD